MVRHSKTYNDAKILMDRETHMCIAAMNNAKTTDEIEGIAVLAYSYLLGITDISIHLVPDWERESLQCYADSCKGSILGAYNQRMVYEWEAL